MAATRSGSAGLQGTVPANPPSQAPVITSPRPGQSFSSVPITVSGLCTSNLLVEVFKNGVFAGSAECTNGSFSLSIDLFRGQNDLIARMYDDLDQAGPDSATVSVTFNDSLPSTGPRISITSAYAKRGAQPNQILTWPITISGGTPPYALSIDWGDKTPADLISLKGPGNVSVSHTYTQSGIFNVTMKASDNTGAQAFLTVVGIANGTIQQPAKAGNGANVTVQTRVLWLPIIILFVMLGIAFWLGQNHQVQMIRARIRKGQRPL